MLIIFRELACIYTNHESLIPPPNKQTLLKYKFNAINLALLCLNETEDCNGYSLPVTRLDFGGNNFGIYTSLLEDKDIVESVFFVSQENLNSFLICVKGNMLYNELWPSVTVSNEVEREKVLKAYVCSKKYVDAIKYVSNGGYSPNV